jgi:uncharacterized iron-regulated protein
MSGDPASTNQHRIKMRKFWKTDELPEPSTEVQLLTEQNQKLQDAAELLTRKLSHNYEQATVIAIKLHNYRYYGVPISVLMGVLVGVYVR